MIRIQGRERESNVLIVRELVMAVAREFVSFAEKNVAVADTVPQRKRYYR